LSEAFTDRGEAQTHVKILTRLIDEPIPAVVSGIGDALPFHFGSHIIDNLIFFIRGVKVGNFSRGQQIIDVDQESFIGDLPFGKEPEQAFVLDGGFGVVDLDIGFQIGKTVTGGNRDIHRGEIHDVTG